MEKEDLHALYMEGGSLSAANALEDLFLSAEALALEAAGWPGEDLVEPTSTDPGLYVKRLLKALYEVDHSDDPADLWLAAQHLRRALALLTGLKSMTETLNLEGEEPEF